MRTIQNTRIHFLRIMQGFTVIQRVVYVVTTGLQIIITYVKCHQRESGELFVFISQTDRRLPEAETYETAPAILFLSRLYQLVIPSHS
jgi:hypothetical protein